MRKEWRIDPRMTELDENLRFLFILFDLKFRNEGALCDKKKKKEGEVTAECILKLFY